MKDLFVLTADEGAKQFLVAILSRPEALGIREISFDIERHTYRDGGVVNTGPEWTRSRMGQYAKVVLLWDHEGSGKESLAPTQVEKDLVEKLQKMTWSENCSAIAIITELEAWLWSTESVIANYYQLTPQRFDELQADSSSRLKLQLEQAKAKRPKELFESVIVDGVRKSISPRDFRELGEKASIAKLKSNPSFLALLSVLQKWFPQVAPCVNHDVERSEI